MPRSLAANGAAGLTQRFENIAITNPGAPKIDAGGPERVLEPEGPPSAERLAALRRLGAGANDYRTVDIPAADVAMRCHLEGNRQDDVTSTYGIGAKRMNTRPASSLSLSSVSGSACKSRYASASTR